MTLRYADSDAYFLGLMPGKQVELELQGEWKVTHSTHWWGKSTYQWCYWVLKPGQAYQGFTVEQGDCERAGGLWNILAEEGAVDSGHQYLEFVKYCSEEGGDDHEGGDEDHDEDEDEDEDDDWRDKDWWWMQSGEPG